MEFPATFSIHVSQKAIGDWRSGVILRGLDSDGEVCDLEFRSCASTAEKCIHDLIESVKQDHVDCYLPTEGA